MKRTKIPYSLPDDEYVRRKAEFVLANTKPNERGCLEWQGYRHSIKHYGQIGMKGSKNVHTHRVVYQGMRGPIPDGWDVCHTCDNPPCVNPLHLFAAPRVANLIDMRNKGRNRQTQKTHCPHGHEYTPENTLVMRGWRTCRTCEKARSRRYTENGTAKLWQRRRRERNRLQSGKTGSNDEH